MYRFYRKRIKLIFINIFISFISNIFYIYLKLVYLTIKWEYITLKGYSLKQLNTIPEKKIFLLWHNRLAILPAALTGYQKFYALASSGHWGRLIAAILKKFGSGIIEGSTNRNPIQATRQMIRILNEGSTIAITPDGPRGPAYQVNSKIAVIAKITRADIILVSANVSNYITINNSWDKLVIPLPFGRGIITNTILTDISAQENEVINQKITDELNSLLSIQPSQDK